jgi:hypothetical protein
VRRPVAALVPRGSNPASAHSGADETADKAAHSKALLLPPLNLNLRNLLILPAVSAHVDRLANQLVIQPM